MTTARKGQALKGFAEEDDALGFLEAERVVHGLSVQIVDAREAGGAVNTRPQRPAVERLEQ